MMNNNYHFMCIWGCLSYFLGLLTFFFFFWLPPVVLRSSSWFLSPEINPDYCLSLWVLGFCSIAASFGSLLPSVVVIVVVVIRGCTHLGMCPGTLWLQYLLGWGCTLRCPHWHAGITPGGSALGTIWVNNMQGKNLSCCGPSSSIFNCRRTPI